MPDMSHTRNRVGFTSQHHRWPPGTRFLGAWRMRRAIPVVAIVLAIGALSASAILGDQVTSAGARVAGHILIRQADLHVDTTIGDDELEVDLSISQMQNDCETPLRGRFCLRYTILLEDKPIQSGYGLMPSGNVETAESSITLWVDTSHEPGVIRTAGTGGTIALTWSTLAALPRPVQGASALTSASVQGSIVGYVIPRTNVTAGVLLYGGP